MKANGRRAWRKWAKRNGAGRGAMAHYGVFRRHRDSTYAGVDGMRPQPKAKTFTPRSLVGMSQRARKRAWVAGRLDRLLFPHGVDTDELEMQSAYSWSEIRAVRPFLGQRLRPCPGCPACDEPRSSVRQLRGWVRLAGLRLFTWKRIATEPCNGFTGRWSAGWTVHLRNGERIGGAWRDDDLRVVWETAAQHCLNGMRKALGAAPRCDGSGTLPTFAPQK